MSLGPKEYVRYLMNQNMIHYVAPLCVHKAVNLRLQALWIIGNLAMCEDAVAESAKNKDVIKAIVQVGISSI